jgi:hypothetical protein
MEPIYRTNGSVAAVVHRGHLYNTDGEWIGFLRGAEVYDPGGEYVGYLSEERRLLRRRTPPDRPRLGVPPRPPRLRGISSRFPLAPLFPELPHSIIDLFEEHPERLRHISATRPDLD